MTRIAVALLLLSACQSASPTPGAPDAGAVVVSDAGSSPEDAGQAEDAGNAEPALTWHRDIRPLVERRCANCHTEGQIGPFVLNDYGSVVAAKQAVAVSVSSGSMPPWQVAKDCNEYEGNIALTEQEKADLLAWIDDDTPEGDPADYVAPELPQSGLSRTDVTLELPVDYTPQIAPDDYRCFMVDWPEAQQKYITGFGVTPGNPAVVHHVIAFKVSPRLVDRFQRRDDEEEGPGYPCFGGPGEITDGVEWIGSWAPGGTDYELPEGTGQLMEPGSKVVIQVHYNTLGIEPQSDRTQVRFKVDETVAKPSRWLPWTNPFWVSNRVPMSIPAGAIGVRHEFAFDPTIPSVGLPFGEGQPFDIHLAGVHMHLLGRTITLSIERADGGTTCLEDVPEWDFNWQGGVQLKEPVRFFPGDRIKVACEYDNTPERQPTVDGVRIEPRDVIWGEGTTDEMCLGLLFVSPVED